MEGTYYRRQGSDYRVSGTSALAPERYYGDEEHAPVFTPRVPPKRMPQQRAPQQPSQAMPPLRRTQERQRGIRLSVMVVSLGLMFTVLSGMALSRGAANSALQSQINQEQARLVALRNTNQDLEAALARSTDDEMLRNYAVNGLGMVQLQAGMVEPIQMPVTRPMGEAPANTLLMRHGEGGFFAMLANLLRHIPL